MRLVVVSMSLALVLLALPLAGCANRGVVPVQTAGASENPAVGPAVRIVEIRDERAFQSSPSPTLTPSFSAHETDPAQRARAVGRKRTADRRPGAVVFLEADRTVQSIVRDAVGRALRSAGFRVLEPGMKDYAAATGLEISIEQLWMSGGERRLGRSRRAVVECEMRIRIAGPLPGLEVGPVVEAYREIARGGFTRSMWRQALEGALEELTEAAAGDLARVRRAMAFRTGA